MVHGERRRYVAVHIRSPRAAGKGLIIKMIRDRTGSLEHGEYEGIKPWVVYHCDNWAIVKCGHLGRERMIEILRSLDGTPLKEDTFNIEVVGVSGTIRRAFRKYIPPEVRMKRHFHEELERR